VITDNFPRYMRDGVVACDKGHAVFYPACYGERAKNQPCPTCKREKRERGMTSDRLRANIKKAGNKKTGNFRSKKNRSKKGA
jgi:hypothetical protein